VNAEAERVYQGAWLAMATAQYDDAARGFLDAAPGIPFFLERLVMVATADAFDLAGKPDSAIAHYEKFVATPDPYSETHALFRAGVHKRLGELYEARGDTAKAESHYVKFIELWKDADPELQPQVREIRDRLARSRRRQG
jgi:tetratricopeptide (TPR) repeat protein